MNGLFTFEDIINEQYLQQFSEDYQLKLKSFSDWAYDFLSKPHAELGRDGIVCPFTPGAIRNNTFWVCPMTDEKLTKQDILNKINELRDKFLTLEPIKGYDRYFKTIVIPFFSDEISALVDEIQKEQKIYFIEKGLMIGQFYQGCQESGLWNPDFRPLVSPIPLLAIRFMVSSDINFLVNDISHFKCYLKYHKKNIPERYHKVALEYLNKYDMIPVN